MPEYRMALQRCNERYPAGLGGEDRRYRFRDNRTSGRRTPLRDPSAADGLIFGAEGGATAARSYPALTVFAQILLLSAIIPSIFGLFSGLLRRLFEEWRYRPRLEVEFIPDENGFRTEGTWNEGDKSFPRFT
jgi:hypothetical protein